MEKRRIPAPLHYTTQLRHAKRRSSLDLTLLKPTYFFAPPTSRAGGEPCAI